MRNAIIGLSLGTAALLFHWLVPYGQEVSKGWFGNAILVAAFAYWVHAFRQTWSDLPGPSLKRFEALGLLAVFLALYLPFLVSPPIWTEEVYWLEDARGILNGTLVSPLGFKSDHPANFMAWPCALVLFLTRDPFLAMRLPGVLYALGMIYYVGRTVELFSERRAPWVAYALPLLCGATLRYSQTGWNEINIAAFLVSAQLFYLCAALTTGSPRARVWLALFTALGFSTLYTSFLFSGIAVAMIVVLRPERLRFLVLFYALVGATIGKILQFPERALGRHQKFLLTGDEWGRGFAHQNSLLGSYWENLVAVGKHLAPKFSFVGHPSEMHLDWVVWALALAGLLVTLRKARTMYALPVAFSLSLAGLLLSNQILSPWREFFLLAPILVFAGLGAQALVGKIPRPSLAAGALVLAQATLVYLSRPYTLHPGFKSERGREACAAYRLLKELPPGERVFMPVDEEGWRLRFLVALSDTPRRISTHQVDRPPASFSFSPRPPYATVEKSR